MPVGLVVVSHSRALAAGTADLARQMAPDVTVAEAGGTDDGQLGTSFQAINEALTAADGGSGAVLLYDLGSALLTAELALEMLDPDSAARIRIVDAPLVEGAVAAAVAAQLGSDLDGVAAAAAEAVGSFAAVPEPATTTEPVAGMRRRVTVLNPLGLHARPVGALVRELEGWDAKVEIGRPDGKKVDLRSVLKVVSMAVRGGETVEFIAAGQDAQQVLAVLAGVVSSGFGELHDHHPRIAPIGMGAVPARLGNVTSLAGLRDQPSVTDGVLRAVPGAPGLAVGPLVRLDRAPVHLPGPRRSGDDDLTVLSAAIATAQRKLATGNQFEVAHAALLADPDLATEAYGRIHRGGRDAATAWWTTVVDRADELAAEPDELVAARAVDLREAGAHVLGELGIVVDRIPADLAGGIVLADDIGPGEVPLLVERGAVGVVLTGSSVTAHAVIVARGLGLPMVLRVGDQLARQESRSTVILDGDAGTVTTHPSADDVQRMRSAIEEQARHQHELLERASEPVVLADGRRIAVVANIGSVADAKAAVKAGADGVGLLRTELLVLDRDTFPDEEEQTADLTAVLAELGERPVVVRVLDAGGDKPVTALALDPLHNGFLGLRGLRYLLVHPDVMRTQLRAILRASVGHRVSLMAPMVSVASEAAAFRQAVEDAAESLRESGHAFAPPEAVGVMIEVPSAAIAADEICAEADFISIGTNDLTSYLAAADRTIPEVADLLDPSSTALQRVLDLVCEQVAAAGKSISVCGEVAAMPEQVPGLLRRGVTRLSVPPARIPMIKALLRELPADS